MNRSDLARILAERLGISPSTGRLAVELLFGTEPGQGAIAEALERGERVVISHFGSFAVRLRKGRPVPDPRGGLRTLPERRVPVFRAGEGLRARVR